MPPRKKAEDTGEDIQVVWEQYRARVPEKVRKQMSDYILNCSLTGYVDLLLLTKYVSAQVVKGNIPPAISDNIRKWAELGITAIAAQHNRDRAGSGSAALERAMASVPDRPAISYDNTTEFIPDGLQTLEGNKVVLPRWERGTPTADPGLDTPGE